MAQQPPPSSDLAKLAQELGINLGAVEDVNDPPVYVGAFSLPRLPFGGSFGRTKETKKLSEVITDFFRLDEDQLRVFQEDAFKAGLYGRTAEREDVPFGDYDEDTLKIWAALAERSANFLKAGKQKTLWEALTDAVKNAPAGTSAGREREPLVIRLTNPDDIRAVIGKAASVVTGGKASLSEEDTQALISEMHEAERAAQRSFYEASGSGLPGGPGGEVTEVGDFGEMAKKRQFEKNPKEAQQYSYIESFNTFMDLLRSAG